MNGVIPLLPRLLSWLSRTCTAQKYEAVDDAVPTGAVHRDNPGSSRTDCEGDHDQIRQRTLKACTAFRNAINICQL